MKYKEQVARLLSSYEGAVAWGGADHEESLQEAVNTAFPGLNDEGKAELYARIAEKWEGYRDGMVPRRMWIGVTVNEFMAERAGKARSNLTIVDNVRVGKTIGDKVVLTDE